MAMPSAAIATFNSLAYQELADLTLPSKRRYCERHGYTLEASIYHGDDVHLGTHLSWDRLGLVYQLLDKYDLVFWCDADAIIMNTEHRLEDILGDGEFAVSADLNGLNSGAFLARSTPMSKQFLYAVLTMGRHLYQNHQMREQHAMSQMLMTPPYRDWVTWVPQRAFNSYLSWLYPWPKGVQGTYAPGDFMIQFAGVPLETRIEWARAIVDGTMPFPAPAS